MINAFREGTNAGAAYERLSDYDNGDYEDAEQYYEQYEESFIQSLSQPKLPVAFKCEIIKFEVDMGLGDECIEYNQYPKTTTNSQGQTVLVGEYMYE